MNLTLDLAILVPYLLISSLVTLWGWSIIARKNKTLKWPTTEGRIDEYDSGEKEGELFPRIIFSYTVNGRNYKTPMSHSGSTPPPEFVIIYAEKYPVGTNVKVYYDPEHPENATLEPGWVRGDWLVFGAGLFATLLGLGAILIIGG